MSTAHGDRPHFLQHHFHTPQQQAAAGKMGMWLFLATEILFFGGLFMAYVALRWLYPGSFLAGHEALDWKLGALNTFVLITSSLTMALAVRAAQIGNKKHLLLQLAATIGFACVFMVIKAVEYSHKYHLGLLPGKYYSNDAVAGQPELFFSVYFMMTGLHGIHVLAGIFVLTWILILAWRNTFSPAYHTHVENVGLYWHLVDIIWIFLFPLLYLMR